MDGLILVFIAVAAMAVGMICMAGSNAGLKMRVRFLEQEMKATTETACRAASETRTNSLLRGQGEMFTNRLLAHLGLEYKRICGKVIPERMEIVELKKKKK